MSDNAESYFASEIEKLNAEVVQAPENQRSPVGRFWLSARHKPDHDWIIDRTSCLIPSDRQEKFIGDFFHQDNIMQNYHELAIGDSLHRLGFGVEYSPRLLDEYGKECTPDWMVTTGNGKVIVECLTANTSDAARDAKRKWMRFCQSLCEIPIGAVIAMSPPMEMEDLSLCGVKLPPDDAGLAKIKAAAVEWLKSAPPIGSDLEIDGCEFSLLRWTEDDCVYCDYSGAGLFLIEIDGPLKNKIEKKVLKYASMNRRAQLPFVVSIVANVDTGVGFDDIQDVALGGLVGIYSLKPVRRNLRGEKLVRTGDGLFAKYLELSAITIGKWSSAGRYLVHEQVTNAAADFPLAESAMVDKSEYDFDDLLGLARRA